ncbi:MbnP family protein [Chitinophaga silvisoli]|uniref:Copper-binding protein MbnP-like domain-containing protein n=1 Tax=Chitinophaga silvisoli TaxID=2291814 RepID=A0A3E1P8C2_9BACT|nr:MbnP family protein [Chitinophaga silvisoli]RFM36445.1 hypothetical protein DXN04_02780 [Chitinophaga silvisoli]
MNRLFLFFSLLIGNTAVSQSVILTFTHEVNHQPMRANKAYYTAQGDTFTITKFKYYLSNFSFISETEENIRLSPEYFLVSEDSAASKKVVLTGLPLGRYKAVSFMIGVDSIMNCTGAQSGALDPIYGMFWTWNSGYIMAKLEGTSPASRVPDHSLQFHIGGYRGAHQSQRMVRLNAPFVVAAEKTAVINLVADAATWFNGATPIRFSETSGFMTPGTIGDRIADNYSHMFSVKSK